MLVSVLSMILTFLRALVRVATVEGYALIAQPNIFEAVRSNVLSVLLSGKTFY